MKILFPLSVLISILSGCGCQNEKELTFENKTNRLINTFHKGKKITFANDRGTKHHIIVSEIKDWTNNCMMHASSVNIRHLPENSWGDGHEIRNGKLVQLDQSMIEFSKDIIEPGDGIYISYRNFDGKITDSTEIRQDSLFSYLNEFKYSVIKDEHPDYKDYKNDPLHVMEVFWTEQRSLIGYRLRNGEIFKIEQ